MRAQAARCARCPLGAAPSALPPAAAAPGESCQVLQSGTRTQAAASSKESKSGAEWGRPSSTQGDAKQPPAALAVVQPANRRC